MPLQNRVMPTGEIVAHPARGTLTGNRGILHRDDRTLGTARWRHRSWICCTLQWKSVRRPVMTGRKWTELFFLDEAVALAAGHRPCALCRRDAYTRFQSAWTAATGQQAKAPVMDAALHAARLRSDREQRRFTARLTSLPAGTFVLWQGHPHLVGESGLQAHAPGGYRIALAKTRGAEVVVLTPAPIVDVLRAGYQPALHDTAVI